MSDFPTKEQLDQEIVDSYERTSEHLRSNQQLQQERLAVCNNCPAKTTLYEYFDGCSECNCILKVRVQVRTATCPLGKW